MNIDRFAELVEKQKTFAEKIALVAEAMKQLVASMADIDDRKTRLLVAFSDWCVLVSRENWRRFEHKSTKKGMHWFFIGPVHVGMQW